MQSHIRRVHGCLAVTCHLHFRQNDRDLLRATAITWGWNGNRNKSQNRKLSLEEKEKEITKWSCRDSNPWPRLNRLIQPCAISRHLMQSHIRRVHGCLAVTCHLHFRQNDRDLLRATAITWGWNGNRNKSQNRKLSLGEKEKEITKWSCRDSNPWPFFRSRVRRSNHWTIPAPQRERQRTAAQWLNFVPTSWQNSTVSSNVFVCRPNW